MDVEKFDCLVESFVKEKFRSLENEIDDYGKEIKTVKQLYDFFKFVKESVDETSPKLSLIKILSFEFADKCIADVIVVELLDREIERLKDFADVKISSDKYKLLKYGEEKFDEMFVDVVNGYAPSFVHINDFAKANTKKGD